MANIACGNCHFYDSKNHKCLNPSRDDSKQQYYYGYLSPTDYCLLFTPEVNIDHGTQDTSK